MGKGPGHRPRGFVAPLAPLVLLAVFAAFALLPALAGAQAAQTPPPTPVPVPGGTTSPSPFPTALRTPAPSLQAPEVRGSSAILVDLDGGQVLFSKEPNERRPIASLTKIMTALLTLERSDPSDVVTVSPEAADPGPIVGISQLGLLPGERIKVEQLLYALLLQSANDAALALAEHVSGSVEAFVRAMNGRARRSGLAHTRFASPNGLDDAGYSSAADLATLTRTALTEQPLFGRIVGTEFHEVPPPVPGGTPRIIQNRNALLWLYPGAIGVKTGYTRAAGFCVVASAERDGVRLLAVVLGEPGEPFSDAAALLNYGFAAFERRTVVEEGEALGTVPVGGHRVAVVAGSALEGLVPVDSAARRRVLVLPGVRFPPGVGEVVGELRVSVPGMSLGRVPLVVARVPGPPAPAEPGPWWRRAASAFVSALDGVLDSLFG